MYVIHEPLALISYQADVVCEIHVLVGKQHKLVLLTHILSYSMRARLLYLGYIGIGIGIG